MACHRTLRGIVYLSWACIMLGVTDSTELICPENFMTIDLPNNQYYTPMVCIKPVGSKLNYSSAEHDCAKMHGTLLTLNIFSPQEAQRIMDTLLDSGVVTGWLGMSLEDGKLWWRDEVFEQVDQNTGIFTCNNCVFNATITCASFTFNANNVPLQLKLEQCSTLHPYVCMSRGLRAIPQPAHWCQGGWLSSPDETSCLYFSPERRPFQTARQRCRQAGGQVVQPKTAITTQLVGNLLRGDLRAGLTLSCVMCDVQGNKNDECNRQSTMTCELNQACGSVFTLNQDDDSSWHIATISKSCMPTAECRGLQQAPCYQTSQGQKVCEICCLSSNCNSEIPASVIEELSSRIGPPVSPGSDLTCYVCNDLLATACIESQNVQSCPGTGVCQTRSSMANGKLMLEKSCKPSYSCAANKEVSKSSCTTNHDTPLCYDCCDDPACNEGIPRNGLSESLGIVAATPPPFKCRTCEANSYDECLETGSIETCAPSPGNEDNHCFLKWNREGNNPAILTMGCATEDWCSHNLHQAHYLCNSTVNNPVCAYCCYFSKCTDAAATIPTLEEMMRGRERRKKRQTGQTSVTPVWVGAKLSGGKLTWLDGTVLQSTHKLYREIAQNQESQDMCVTLNTLDTDVTWDLQDCDKDFPVVCSMPSKLERAKIVEQPKNIITTLTEFESTIHQSGDITYRFICQVENAHPDTEVMWKKDQNIYLSNGLPRTGFTLQFNPQLVFDGSISENEKMVDVQGTYQCIVRGMRPFQRVKSDIVTFTFSDVVTFVGSVRLPNVKKDPLFFSYATLNKYEDYLFHDEMKQMLEKLTDLSSLGITIPCFITIWRYRTGSTIVDFYLRYQLPIYDLANLRTIISLLSPTAVVTSRMSRSEVVLILEDLLLNTAINSMKQRVSDPRSSFSYQYGNYNIRPEGITLQSTAACPARQWRNGDSTVLHLPRTPVGEMGFTMEVCVSDGTAMAEAMCNGGVNMAAKWGSVTSYTDCPPGPQSGVTDDLKNLSEVDVEEEDLEEMAEDMERLTNNTAILTSSDLIYVSRIMKNIAQSPRVTTKISRRMLRTVGNVLMVGRKVRKNAQKIDKSQSRTVHSIEHFSKKVNLGGRQEERVVVPNVAMEIFTLKKNSNAPLVRGFGTNSKRLNDRTVLGVTSVHDVNLSVTETAIIFPDEVLNIDQRLEENLANVPSIPNADLMEAQITTDIRLTYFIYRAGNMFMAPSELEDRNIYQAPNSQVVSGSVGGLYIYNLREPVVIIFNPEQANLSTTGYCAYWDFEANDGYGNWSTDGCYSNGTVNGRIICRCNHLTNFAILTDWEQGEGISAKHREILGLITIIGLCLSNVGLGLTILSFVLFKKLRKGRSQKVLVNLALALLCVNIVFLVGIERTEHYEACIAVAALLHYFLLAAFLWMLMEGILQYLKFVKVLNTYVENFMWKATVPSWGIPAIIVGIVAAIDYELYRGPEDYCWVDQPVFYYAFMLPVGIIIVVNAVLFILVVKGITCDRPKNVRSTQSDKELALLQCRAAVCCFIILGITWVFGFLAVEEASLVFQYLFCIFNALQGFLIFIFHHVREPAVRKAWMALCCKGERNQKYLSSSEGNTYSTGPRTPTSSEHKPSVQIDEIENNNLASYPEIGSYQLNASGGTQRSSKI